MIHFYKFFRSGKISSQTLATKNLTFYCFLLFAYLLLVFRIRFFLSSDSVILYHRFDALVYYTHVAYIYMRHSLSFFKLIMALDIFLCFRNISLHLQRPPPGNQNNKFYAYCLLGISIPAVYLYLTHNVYTIRFTKEELLTFIRIARLIPTVGAFWYIRSTSIDKSELWVKFSLYIRLLIMLGGLAALLSVSQVYLKISLHFSDYSLDEDSSVLVRDNLRMQHFFSGILDTCTVLEGIIIGIFFTFKKDTFRSSYTADQEHTQVSFKVGHSVASVEEQV